MQGALCLRHGILYVGRHERTAHVRPYDLDGGPLGAGFSLRGPDGEACALGGFDVDQGHRVWLADRLAARVRVFTLFGREVAGFAGAQARGEDQRGCLSQLSDLTILSDPEAQQDPRLLVARSCPSQHAVQLLSLDGRWLASLRSNGEPQGRFRDARAVACRGRFAYVCERLAGRVQVFRDGEFHFALSLPVQGGGRFEPVALAPLRDGRMVIACGGHHSALLLLDGSGRLVRTLAKRGSGEGQVLEPGDVVVEEDAGSGEPRIAVIDRDAERVQVLTLGGRCHGELGELPGRALQGPGI